MLRALVGAGLLLVASCSALDDDARLPFFEIPDEACNGENLVRVCRADEWTKISNYGFEPTCRGTPYLPGPTGPVYREGGEQGCVTINEQAAPVRCCP